jgi:hypothetical protein
VLDPLRIVSKVSSCLVSLRICLRTGVSTGEVFVKLASMIGLDKAIAVSSEKKVGHYLELGCFLRNSVIDSVIHFFTVQVKKFL